MIFLQIKSVMWLITGAETCIIDVGMFNDSNYVLAEILTLKLQKWLNYSHPEQKEFKNNFADKLCICQWKENNK